MPEHASDGQLSVSDLAERSGLPVSTIRYYVREGLVPAGQRLSHTRIVYHREHLTALKTVKSLREAGVPLTEIRSQASHVTDTSSSSAIAEARRNDVLEAATSSFLSAGFAGTSLGEIARSASMSKATLHGYFGSKEEIFMACAERVFHRLYADVWPGISQAQTADERVRARWDAFVESFADWAPMMDLVRGLAIGNRTFTEGYLRLTDTIVAPLTRELSMLGAGQRVDTDSEFISYIVMGMAEAGARALKDGRHDAESAWHYLAPILAEPPRGPADVKRPPGSARRRSVVD